MNPPKTLNEAINNALVMPQNDDTTLADHIESHVTNFLSQKFGESMSKNRGLTEVLRDLFKSITETP